MSAVFFKDLGIPAPHVNLEVGSGTHGSQTGKIMMAFDPVLEKEKPDLIIVVGDVNSTIACSLVASKHGIRVAHVEAGLRSFDWKMPEEINRVLTDRLSDFLFISESSANKNLRREGIDSKKIFFVGNVMIDTLLHEKSRAEVSPILQKLGLRGKQYVLITLHRPSNVDSKNTLRKIMQIFEKIHKRGLEVIFPVHPRTQTNLKKWRIKTAGLRLIPPVGYLDFVKLMSHATAVLTDSGGIQEETTILGVPCLTLRENTERPVTVANGTNTVVGSSEGKILKALGRILKNGIRKKGSPRFWDGKAAERIVKILERKLHSY